MSEVQPYDREAEQSVLGGMMLSAKAVWDVADQIQPTDFHDPRHEAIATAVFELANNSNPTDAIAVCDVLERNGDLNGSLDRGYVFGLVSSTPVGANAGYWAGIVREKALLRRLVEASSSIAHMATSGEGTAVDMVEQARAEIDAVSEGSSASLSQIGASFASFVNGLEEKPRYIPSPWWDINSLIGGFRAGGLYIIGARPAQGKSIVGLNAAMRLARTGPVAYCSLEMSKDDITARMVAQLGQVHLQQLMTHDLSRQSWQQVAIARPQIEQVPLFVATSDEVSTITQVRAFARSVSRKSSREMPMAGLVVDYLQLMSSGKREESRQVEVAGFSRSLKMLAQDLGIPVIALSQLNRQVEKGGKARKPTMADLRESGSIEQDADVVMLLNHDERQRPNDLDVIVAKNRHGKTGEVTLSWEGHFSRVLSRDWSPTALLGETEGM